MAENPARVRSLRDLRSGERYWAVYSPTGVCIYRSRDERDAERVRDRDPRRREVKEHVKK